MRNELFLNQHHLDSAFRPQAVAPANTSEFLSGAKVLCLNLVTWILGEKAESTRSDCNHCQMVPSNVMSKLTISAARSAMCWYTTSYMTDRMRGSLLSCKRMILAVVFVTSVNVPHALLDNVSQSWSSTEEFSWSRDTEWVISLFQTVSHWVNYDQYKT